MRRRAPLQNLRGSDPMMLEVQLADLLLRPSDQLEPPNLCDLFALSEMESPPKAIRGDLRKFIERAKAELAEINDGSEMKNFTTEWASVDAGRVPTSLRDHVRSLANRDGRDGTALWALLENWSATEPEPFVIGEQTMKVQTAEAVQPREKRIGGKVLDEPKAKRGRGGKTPRKISKPAKVVDVEKNNLIRDIVIDRLSGVSDSGLAENVLIAGVRFRAKKQYPKMGPQDITAVLRDLLKRGLVRKSAGRWSRA